MVENSNYYLEGNITTAKGRDEVVRSALGYDFGCYKHDRYNDTTASGHVKRFYVRPNYGQPPAKQYTDPDPINYYPPERDLSFKEPVSSCGFDVCWVQCILKRMGYTDTVNGVYDEKTRDAVNRFKSDCGLSSDGITDNETTSRLREKYNELYLPKLHDLSITKDSFYPTDSILFNTDGENYDNIKLFITILIQVLRSSQAISAAMVITP